MKDTGMETVPAEEGRADLWVLGRIGPRGVEGSGTGAGEALERRAGLHRVLGPD